MEDKLNEYRGFVPSPSGTIDRIKAVISPDDFFTEYISKRKPVIIEGHLLNDITSCHLWSNKYLYEKVRDANVIVEQRQEGAKAFGLDATKVSMTYGDFLMELEGMNNEGLYLTTQDLERFEDNLDEFGFPCRVLAEPLCRLKEDFSIRPSLVGNLVPYQLSLWQGSTKDGTSSGLHHDFHDNLYLLLRGRKRFRLFPPSGAQVMRVSGKLKKIYGNGLIVYTDHGHLPLQVREDGAPYIYLAKMKKAEAEKNLSEAEEALSRLKSQPGRDLSEEEFHDKIRLLEKNIERYGTEIEELMDTLLELGADKLDSSDYDEDDISNGNATSETSDEEEESLFEDEHLPKKRIRVENEDNTNFSKKKERLKDAREKKVEKTSTINSGIPNHFCNIKLPSNTDNFEEVFAEYPELKNVGHIICELNEGEVLYLPASWFHEVTSFSKDSTNSGIITGNSISDNSGQFVQSGDIDHRTIQKDTAIHSIEETKDIEFKNSGHLALNYWFFPPDGQSFEKPYNDDFWERRWANIEEHL